jgi:hypothetical protein
MQKSGLRGGEMAGVVNQVVYISEIDEYYPYLL